MTRKGIKLPSETLTRDEVERLLKACSIRSATGIRNRALICCMYRSGLRIAEALDLFPKDGDAEAGTVRVLKGKGSKARTVGMDAGAFAIIQRWLDKRSELGMNGKHPLFCTLTGEPLKASYVRALLPRLARKARIEKRVHPHCLRHTMAVELMREGVPIATISKQLGHSNISTTARYLDHIAPSEVIATMQQRTWNP